MPLHYLWRIINAIITGNARVQLFNDLAYIKILFTPDKEHSCKTNYIDSNNTRHYIRRFYLSPFTLRLLNHLLSFSSVNNKTRITHQELKKHLKSYLGKVTFGQYTKLGKNLSSMIKKSIFVVENLGVDIKQPLVHYSIGKLPSYDLPETFYEYKKLNDVKPFERILTFQQIVQDASNTGVKGDTANKLSSAFENDLKEALRAHYNKKTSSLTMQNKLQNILDNKSLVLQERWLVSWYISLLKKGRKPSTIRIYHSLVYRRWLTMTYGEDLRQYSSEDFTGLYERINSSIKSKHTEVLARFIQLHKFGVKTYRVAPLDEDIHQPNKQDHIRSGFITESVFRKTLENINDIKQYNATDKDIIKAILIIAYRCGLRIGEILKIQLQDIVIGADDDYWVNIRPNKFGNNKTYHSYRTVPLSSMLLKYEKDILHRLIDYTKQPQSLVLSKNDIICNEQDIRNIAQYYLRNITGNEYIVFHHLRHSCMSRLQLMSLGEYSGTLSEFIPYGQQKSQDIISLICEKNENFEFALAKFAGHANPAITYERYYHFTSYVLGKMIVNANIPIDKKTANSFFGIGRYRYQTLSNNNILLPKDTLSFLISRCPIVDKPIKLRHKKRKTPVLEDKKHTISFDINLVQELLTLYITDKTLYREKVDFYGYNHYMDALIHSAKIIKSQYITNDKTSRLFKKDSYALVPSVLHTPDEKKLCEQFIKKLRTHSNTEGMREIIHYTLNNCRYTKSGVYFTDPNKLTDYLSELRSFIPKQYWHAELIRVKGSTEEKAWCNALKNVRHKTEKKDKSKANRYRGAVRLKLVANPKNKKSSNFLVYLLHLAEIMFLAQSYLLVMKPSNQQDIILLSSFPRKEILVKHMVALLNSSSEIPGQIYISVKQEYDNNYKKVEDYISRIKNWMRFAISPAIEDFDDVELIQIADDQLLKIVIPKGSKQPYRRKEHKKDCSGYFIRHQQETISLDCAPKSVSD